MTRRERQRSITRDEIKALARQQMAESGTAAISLAGIARTMELTPPALYRYYAGRDELITALIVDAYAALASAVRTAVASQPDQQHSRRLRSALLAYRDWARANPTDFQLIFGNPIPGYSAPTAITLPAARQGLRVILEVLQQAHAVGVLRLPAAATPMALPPVAGSFPEGLDPAVLSYGIAGWARIHGLVMLELFQHLQPIVADTDAFFQHEVATLLREAGLDPDE